MTPLEIFIALASVVGAALFFVSGYAFKAQRADDDEEKDDIDDEEATRLKAELDERNKRLASVQRKLADTKRTVSKLEDKVEELGKAQSEEKTSADDEGPDVEKLEQRVHDLEGAIEEERAHKARLEKELEEAKAELSASQSDKQAEEERSLAALREEKESLQAKLDELEEEARAGKAKEDTEDDSGVKMEELESEMVALRAEAAKASAHARKVGELEEEMRRCRASIQEKETLTFQLEEARTELGVMGRELTETKNRADQAQHVLDAIEADARELRTARAEIGALRTKAQRASGRAQELERLREENQKLKGEINELQQQKESMSHPWPASGPEEVDEGEEQQARRLKALERTVSERAALRSRVEELSRRAAESEPPAEQKGEALTDIDRTLMKLGESAELRAAVIADDMGLLVGGVGETRHQEDVAALSGLAVHLASRAQDLLSLGKVEQVQLQDSDDMVLYCRLFETADQSFSLSTLTKEHAPSKESVVEQLQILRESLG